MKIINLKIAILVLLLVALLFLVAQSTSGQELSGGAKIVGTSPFVFAEAKLWIESVEIGAGLASNDSGDSEYGYETGPIDFSIVGKVSHRNYKLVSLFWHQ